ncbi:hypothetical protein VFPPC_14110 [Pochonia chlamydosporia 170]|uniref:Uncharacterized protein n=1 Tax=Pochonia chlamydosporia 170 TaxID=1380566 RepID=A0A179F5G9_METCM|nr:hypothetical protein VFPPC_14110 [Pochonia chlamydosporia 170]OAQ60674.1 hypothetical protein VFPPC_14110 [Pochonia chlamydosporia 170]
MVRINNFALLALSASALAATTHNARRSIDSISESDLIDRAVPLMGLDRRQQNNQQDSPEVQKLKEDRKAISVELAQAQTERQDAEKAMEAAIPQDLKTKEDQARQALKDARKAANDAIPADLKQKEEAAFQKVKSIREGLPEDKKKALQENGKALRAARKGQKSAAPAPAASVPPAPAAPAASPAPPPPPAAKF